MSVHTISVLVENQSGSLSRISGLFSSRGYNISSLSVAETEDSTISRMTIVSSGDDDILEQIVKHLNRLVDVIKVMDFRSEPMIERELLLITVSANSSNRHELKALADIYGATVAAVNARSITLEISEESAVVQEFINIVKPYGLKELVRSGKVALAKVK